MTMTFTNEADARRKAARKALAGLASSAAKGRIGKGELKEVESVLATLGESVPSFENMVGAHREAIELSKGADVDGAGAALSAARRAARSYRAETASLIDQRRAEQLDLDRAKQHATAKLAQAERAQNVLGLHEFEHAETLGIEPLDFDAVTLLRGVSGERIPSYDEGAPQRVVDETTWEEQRARRESILEKARHAAREDFELRLQRWREAEIANGRDPRKIPAVPPLGEEAMAKHHKRIDKQRASMPQLTLPTWRDIVRSRNGHTANEAA